LYIYFMKKTLYILFLIAFFVQCKTQQTNSTNMTSYEYIDGNGNLYAISKTAIVYDPITAEESSTGTYNGGEPYTAPLAEKQFNDLELVFKNCIQEKEGQTTSRNKGTGTLVILPSKIHYIFEMDSWQKKVIEAGIKMMTQR